MLIIIRKNKINATAVEAARPVIAEMVAAANALEGCVNYAITQDPNDPAVIYTIDIWTDMDAFNVHQNGPHTAKYGIAMSEFGYERIEQWWGQH